MADDDDVGKTEDFSCPSSVCGFGVERCITKGPASILLAICRKDVRVDSLGCQYKMLNIIRAVMFSVIRSSVDAI